MNRAEKRRQRKLSKNAAKNTKPVQSASSSPGQQTLTIQQAIDLAVQHHNAGRLPEAESIYQKILQDNPNQPVALHQLGIIAHQMGKNDIAVDLIAKALAIKPDFAEAHNNLGKALQKQGKPDEAIASYHKALAIKPDFAEAHNNLGATLRELGKPDEAVASFHKALAIKPDFAEAHNNLGNTLQVQGKLDEAVASYHKALAITPGYAAAHNNLGLALQGQDKLDEAVAIYHKALAIKPDYAEAQSNLGATLRELGKPDEAIAAYRKAIDLKPDFFQAYVNLHAMLYRQGDIEESADALACAINANPDYVLAHFLLGTIYDQRENLESAEREFAHVLRLDNRCGYLLDSWDYVKSRRGPATRLFADKFDTLDFALGATNGDGLILEFGVRFGQSVKFIAARTDGDVHGFDSFEGLPESWEAVPLGAYTTQGVLPEVPLNVHLHVGLFADSLPGFLRGHPGAIQFMNVDCDIYSSTETIFQALSDRIISGTVIVFDEYICNSNWRSDEFKAFQEAVERNHWDYEYLAFSLWSKQAVVKIL